MPRLQIKNHRTGETLYEGSFDTAKDCIEQAASEGVNLDYADLHHTNLSNAALDDIVMRHARLDGSNLTGANLSEARLDGTSFTNTTMHGACLCESSLKGCNFEGASFGATDITGSILQNCSFSTLSAFTLNFINAKTVKDCRFEDNTKAICPFSKPPVILQGLALPVILLDRHLKIGSTIKTYQDWLNHTNDNTPPGKHDNTDIYIFFKKYQAMFREMHEGLHSNEGTHSTLRRINVK